MAIFDYVFIECPHCKEINEEHSKTGDSRLDRYQYPDIPFDVGLDLLKRTLICDHCGELYSLELVNRPMWNIRKEFEET